MKRYFSSFFRYFDSRILILYVIILVIMLSPYRGDVEVIRNVFGGVPLRGTLPEIPALGVLQWCLLICPPLFTAAYSYSLAKSGYAFSLYRLGRRRWWNGVCNTVVSEVVVYVLIGVLAIPFVCGDFKLYPLILLNFTVHLLFLSILMLSLFTVFKSMLPAVLIPIMMDALSHILTVFHENVSPYLIGTWGMTLRSDLFVNVNAFPFYPMLIAQLVITILIAVFTPMFLYKD